MKKVLITGFTSTQTNPISHQRSMNFTGLMHDELRDRGVEVLWQEPSLAWDAKFFSQFDKILFGLASPLAISSSKTFGAFHALKTLEHDLKVVYFTDQADLGAITRGFASVLSKPESLLKPFFSTRRGWPEFMVRPRAERQIEDVCLEVLCMSNRTFLYPRFPWETDEMAEALLPSALRKPAQVVGINLDRRIFREVADVFPHRVMPAYPRNEFWSAEKTSDWAWIRRQFAAKPVQWLPRDHRVRTDEKCIMQLASSIGFMFSPDKSRRTPWTPKVAMALQLKVPVVTDWITTGGYFSQKAWRYLPVAIEDDSWTARDRIELGHMQFDGYCLSVSVADGPERFRIAFGG